MEKLSVKPWKSFVQGATVYPDGVNFCVYSKDASTVSLYIFENQDDVEPYFSFDFSNTHNKFGDLWGVFIEGLKPGALYLYKIGGKMLPLDGLWFDEKRFLFDPFAKAFTNGSVFLNIEPGTKMCRPGKMPKCVVVDDNAFDWEDDRPLQTPGEKTIIYEAHLKGMTAGDKSIDENIRGTYKGLVEKIPYLQELGITAIELLPIHEFDENENGNIDPKTGERLKNYWGYSTIGFFAPKAGYASDKTPGACVTEFKEMVKAFHKAGIEVILDVVFNHTAEGNEHGVPLNFRGFQNDVYYHLVDEHKEYYKNYSGCGNAVNANHPVVSDYITECLRYWVSEMHIDGFRFDLASELTRNQSGAVDRNPALTNRLSCDPILRGTKLIAEPWDCGGAYHVGCFPGGNWIEWNDKFRDGIRKFIRGDEYLATEAATRIAGSSDLYAHDGRSPLSSINFINAHDGFTLNDLVTYNGKHNDENGEGNRDGNDNNLSYNYGFEGECTNPKIARLRKRQIKNFLACLFLSQGTPMFNAGDEFRRTQGGNNNAYCQDNEISWIDWSLAEKHSDILDWTKKLIKMRKSSALFQRKEFFKGEKDGEGFLDISWFDYEGKNPDWSKSNRFLAFRLGGEFYVAMNMDIHDVTVTIPRCAQGKKWYRLADSSIEDKSSALDFGNEEELYSQDRCVLLSNSVIILRCK